MSSRVPMFESEPRRTRSSVLQERVAGLESAVPRERADEQESADGESEPMILKVPYQSERAENSESSARFE